MLSNIKRSITIKLIAVLIGISVVLVGVMALATRLSFQESFLDYVTEAELDELDGMEGRLSSKYAEEGSWAFIAYKHKVWMSYLPEKIRPKPNQKPPKNYDQYRLDLPPHKRPRLGPPPPPPNDKSGLGPRLRLLDIEGKRLIGAPDTSGRTMKRAIKLDGKIIGYLSLSYAPLPIEGIDERFRDDHLEMIYYIAVVGLLIAISIGVPIGRRFIRPVKSITAGAHELAQGKFETRIQPQGHDELGQLAHDFNGLASALERNETLRLQGMADKIGRAHV